MTELNIKITMDDIANYIDEDKIQKIVSEEIESRVKRYYEDDIRKLVDNYLIHAMKQYADELFISTPELKEILEQKVKNKIENVSNYEVFYHQSNYGSIKDGEAVMFIDSIFKDKDNRAEFEEIIRSKFNEKFENMNCEDFITHLGYEFMDFMRCVTKK